MTESFSRHLRFDSVANFRDIGGYRTREGRTVAWRRVFRSGEFQRISNDEFDRLMTEIRPVLLLDLRSAGEVEKHGRGLLSEAAIKYQNISFITDGGDREADEKRFRTFTNMGEFYLDITRDKGFGKRIVAALEIIAMPENHPLVFHCAVGKDRTGILAALVLSLLGVEDEDIKMDYSLSEPYMDEILRQIKSDPKATEAANPLPDYFWKASPESMELFLTTLRQEYGSIKGYLEAMGMEPSLPARLENALLV
jgi:protein-tyrosine phosphatase